MVEELQDIEILQNAIIAFQEGASDEKRMAISSLQNMIARKQAIVYEFEKQAPGYQFELDI